MLNESHKRTADFKKQFKETYCRHCNDCMPPTTAFLIAETVMSGAPSYYISYNHARRLLSCYRRGQLPVGYNKLRRDMIAEIARKIDNFTASHIGKHSEGEALTMVLAEGKASRFFISPSSAMRLLYR
ncbi:MAG: hypothetical protein E7081_01740 [Bacteroidales bacterium]|nr:hypothetical protein [Bacteroidales bacterium]